MNKYQSQINKAKSIKALQKVANSLGVGIGNMKNIDKIKAKLTRELEKQQSQIKTEMETMRINRQSNRVNRDFTKVSEAEKRFLKSFKKASPYERDLFIGNKTAHYLDKTVGSPLYFHNFKSKEEFNNFINRLSPENRSQFIKDYINSLDLNNYKKINPRLTKRFNERVAELYEVGALNNQDMKNHKHLTDIFNSLDYVRQMEAIDTMDSAEYRSMVESLVKKGYSEPLAIEITLQSLGVRSDDYYTTMK